MQGNIVGGEDDDNDNDEEKVVDACVGKEAGVSRPRIRLLRPEFIKAGQCQPSELRQRRK